MQRRKTIHAALAAAGLLVVAVAAGCGGDDDPGNVAANAPSTTVLGEPVVAGGGALYVLDELRDWVSYTDLVAVVTVVDETRSAPQGPGAPREGWVNNAWTATVDEVVWASPQLGDAPGRITFGGAGYALRESGVLAPFAGEGSPLVKVGDRLLVALGRSDGNWLPFTPDSVQRVGANGRIAPEDDHGPGADLLRGRTPGDLRRELARLKPEPEAAAHMDVESGRRWLVAHRP